jgi:hypothetical protein
MRTVFDVVSHGVTLRYTNFEDAARHWDKVTHLNPSDGGIQILQWQADGRMVRDGWLIHVEGGRVYVNPSLNIPGYDS